MLMGNITATGSLDVDKFQRALLMYRNSVDPETKASPALILFGRPIRDAIPIPTRMMFIKHYAPNRCLCIKVANSIDLWVEDCRIAEMSQRQGEGGGYVQRMEVIVKRKKSRVGGGGSG